MDNVSIRPAWTTMSEAIWRDFKCAFLEWRVRNYPRCPLVPGPERTGGRLWSDRSNRDRTSTLEQSLA